MAASAGCVIDPDKPLSPMGPFKPVKEKPRDKRKKPYLCLLGEPGEVAGASSGGTAGGTGPARGDAFDVLLNAPATPAPGTLLGWGGGGGHTRPDC
jgi:hypothetical protein